MCQESQTELGIRYPCSNKEHPPQQKTPKQKPNNHAKKMDFHPLRGGEKQNQTSMKVAKKNRMIDEALS